MMYTQLFTFLTTFSLVVVNATPVKRAEAYLLRAKSSPDNCLGITGNPYNGIGLSNLPCSEADVPNTNFKGRFEIVRGNNPNGIRLQGTNFCIDATLPISETGSVTLYTCLPGTAQQTWYYTDDNHIALTGQTGCIDFAGGGCGRFTCSPGKARCGPGLFNQAGQEWTLSVPSGPIVPPPTQQGALLHPNGDNSRCVFGGNIKEALPGVVPFVETCVYAGPNFGLQYFAIQRGRGAIKVAGSYNLCLDYGSNPQNGAVARLQTCNGGSSQDFYYTGAGDDHIAITGGTLCLDLRREDQRTLQFWTCGSNPQQKFTI